MRSQRSAGPGPARLLVVGVFVLLVVGWHAPLGGAAPSQPFQTAIVDPELFTSADAAVGLRRAAAAGASVIKVPLFWNEVAPADRPPGFKPDDPNDPAYNWSQLDTQLRLIRAHGLTPLVYISSAPTWAFATSGGFRRPDPAQFGAFALAAVRRYSGESSGLPRVRYWQAWNEPNKVAGPGQKATAAAWYRTIVNAFAASVHSKPGNIVVAGGLSPFGRLTAVAPLTFMRDLLCVSTGSIHSTCSSKVAFDVWSTDPYTAGGPSHRAAGRNDVSVAELPRMKAVLDASTRLGHVVSNGPVRFWVTEFSWDSDPPDSGGVPAALEGRWVSEAFYKMWSSGVSLVTWFTLRDQPVETSAYQSGLYYRGASIGVDRPKPALNAFQFPFVAYPRSNNVAVWGRTPTSSSGTVVVEQRGPAGWRRLGTLQASSAGIFSGTLARAGRGPLRARMQARGAVSLPFSLVSPPDHFYQPFGAPVPTKKGTRSTSSAVSQYIEAVPSVAAPPAAASPVSIEAAAGPRSALGAAADGVESADGPRAILFAVGILAITLVLQLAAVRKRKRRHERASRAETPE
jgi:hypothetical protein